jgi:plasmid stability protein
MVDSSTQLTIRGLDARTKQRLQKRAAENGMSLNKYALESLRLNAGSDSSEERYEEMKRYLDKHHVSHEDMLAVDEAIAWSHKTSLEKQRREERDATF